MNPDNQINIIICAAGQGFRMGCNKALAMLPNNNTFLQNILLSIAQAQLPKPIVVLGAQYTKVLNVHQNNRQQFSFIINYQWPQNHMIDSIKLALQNNLEANTIIWPVDTPLVTYKTLKKLSFNLQNYITIPTYKSQNGHPILLSKYASKDLMNSNSNSLRDFIQKNNDKLTKLNINDPYILSNFNTINEIPTNIS